MKIVICGEPIQLSYIVDLLKSGKSKNEYILIVPQKENVQQLSNSLKLSIYVGDYTKKYTLDDAHIEGSDLFVALGEKDESNYVACLLAKKVYGVQRVISLVHNPLNVDIFTKLGIDSSVSSVHMISDSIINNVTNESILRSLSIENDQIKILELKINKDYLIVGKYIKDLSFPDEGNISAIQRDTHTIIPKGKTMIKENDKLIICCTKSAETDIVNFITKKNEN